MHTGLVTFTVITQNRVTPSPSLSYTRAGGMMVGHGVIAYTRYDLGTAIIRQDTRPSLGLSVPRRPSIVREC